MYSTVVAAQAVYLFLTGLWPLLHIGSFMAITGYKHDQWLVKQVALLTTSIGVVLIIAMRKRKMNLMVIVLGILSAFSFAAIDVFYAMRGIISPVYMIDAAIESVFIFAHIGRIATTDKL